VGTDIWKKHIQTLDPKNVKLLNNPGVDEFSQTEIDLIDELHSQFSHFSGIQLRNYCHLHASEWKEPGASSIPIFLSDLLDALGKTSAEIEAIKAEQHYQAAFSRLLHSC
jgi:hypothetical protein